jgi:hypothetical protein
VRRHGAPIRLTVEASPGLVVVGNPCGSKRHLLRGNRRTRWPIRRRTRSILRLRGKSGVAALSARPVAQLGKSISLDNFNPLSGGDGSTPVASPPPVVPVQLTSAPPRDRKLALYSRLMTGRMSTGYDAVGPKMALSGPILSKADDCAVLVLSFSALISHGFSGRRFPLFCETGRSPNETGVEIMVANRHFPVSRYLEIATPSR